VIMTGMILFTYVSSHVFATTGIVGVCSQTIWRNDTCLAVERKTPSNRWDFKEVNIYWQNLQRFRWLKTARKPWNESLICFSNVRWKWSCGGALEIKQVLVAETSLQLMKKEFCANSYQWLSTEEMIVRTTSNVDKHPHKKLEKRNRGLTD
jgi:hypothetical protein